MDTATLLLSPFCRYEELLRWAGAALAAQGLDEQAVNQTLADLRQPVEMEDVRREMGSKEEPGGEPGPGEGLGEEEKEEEEKEEELQAEKSFRYCGGAEVSSLPQSASCDTQPHSLRLDQDCDPYSDQDSDQDSELGPEPSVPGPGFVLVVSQVEGSVPEVRRTPLAITEYLQLSLEEVCQLGVGGVACSTVTCHLFLSVCRPSSWSTVWAVCLSTCTR